MCFCIARYVSPARRYVAWDFGCAGGKGRALGVCLATANADRYALPLYDAAIRCARSACDLAFYRQTQTLVIRRRLINIAQCMREPIQEGNPMRALQWRVENPQIEINGIPFALKLEDLELYTRAQEELTRLSQFGEDPQTPQTVLAAW